MVGYPNNLRFKNNRRGGAAVELAIAIPIVFLLLMGSVETANLIYLKQNVTDVAYHGALVGMIRGATESFVQAEMEAMLSGREIQNATVDIAPGQILEDMRRGELFEVRIVVNTAGNNILSFVLPDQDIEVELVARRQ